VLRIGAAYVPLDPELPKPRLDQIVAATGMDTLVTDGTPLEVGNVLQITAETELEEGAVPTLSSSPQRTACILPTSGPIDGPVGIAVSHGAIARLVTGDGPLTSAADEVVLAAANATLPTAQLEVLGALVNGSSLVIVDSREVGTIPELIVTVNVTRAYMPVEWIVLMLERKPEALTQLRNLIVIGGELSEEQRAMVPDTTVTRIAGPAEGALVTEIDGVPAPYTRLHVLDRLGKPVMPGCRGELVIGGAGLASGYVGAAGLTEQRFVPDPSGRGDRIFRTGAAARLTEDGRIEQLGRLDDQLDVRGVRVEPGEIEHLLGSDGNVTAAIVRLHRLETGEGRLHAWVQPAEMPEDRAAESKRLRALLVDRLPELMVPTGFSFLAELPRDHADLPAPDAPEQQDYVAPKTPTERVIVEIWQELLERPRIGIEDDIFALGAHSLLVTRAVTKLRSALGVDVPVKSVFEAPTPEAFAKKVDLLLWTAAPEEEGELGEDEEEGEI